MNRVDDLVSRPTLRPFGPLLYVAWSDGALADEEITSVRDLTRGFPLDDKAHEILESWLDPASPPTAAELARLKARLGGRHETRGTTVERTEAVDRLERELLLQPPEVESVDAERVLDVEALAVFLDGPEREMRQDMRARLSAAPFVRRFGLTKERYREEVLAWTKAFADAGYGGLAFSEDARGTAQFIAAFETAGHFDLNLSVKIGVQFGLFGGSIHNLGAPEQRALLDDVASLEVPGCFAMTERGHGSNVRDLETVARYLPDEDAFEIHTPVESAHKDYIGNAAAHAKMASVFAQLVVGEEEHGVHAFLVPIRDDDGEPCPGVRIEDCGEKMGLQGIDNGRLWFDRVRVPRAALLSRFGRVDDEGNYHSDIASASRRFFTMLGTLVAGRVSVANVAVAAAKSGLATAIGYAAHRRQFGPETAGEVTLLTYPTHQVRLLPLLARTYAAHFATRDLVEDFLVRDEESARKLESDAAGLKVFATRLCTAALQECREACGGQGYLSANRIGGWKADSDVFTTFEGDNVVLLQLVAKGLLTEFQQQFADDAVFGFVRYLARRVRRRALNTNPWVKRDDRSEHLRDARFHEDALGFRESRLLSSAAMRLKHRVDQGQSGYDAFLACQLHLVRLAEAHVERQVLARARAAIENAPEDARPTLDAVLDLYALDCIKRDLGWFCRKSVLDGDKAGAVEREVERLCAELAPKAASLCAAFGIPDALLPPIARGDVTVRTS